MRIYEFSWSVEVFGNYCGLHQQVFFLMINDALGDLHFKWTGLILKPFWSFPNETDPTRR